MKNGATPFDTALELLDRGFWPVALRPGEKRPIGEGWGLSRPTKGLLRAAFRRQPDAGVGIVLGPGGGVVDFEVDGPEGVESLSTLLGGELVETLGWTSRRGPHHLFRWDDRLAGVCSKTVVKLPELPGLELRLGIGGEAQSCCPPTLGDDGQPRLWNGATSIEPLPSAALAFLAAALGEANGKPVEANGKPLAMTTADPAAAWFRKAMENECGKVAMAPEGDRHNALLRAARTLGGDIHHGYLLRSEIEQGLTHAGRRAGLPDSEVASAVRDGLANGEANPLPWPDKLARSDSSARVESKPPEAAEDPPIEAPPWPALIRMEAYHGPIGEIVRDICPQTEADPVGVLATLMIGLGSMIGRGPHIQVGRATHYTNEFAVLVGETSAARKGTSLTEARDIWRRVEPDWLGGRLVNGLSSGEGLIHAVRDPSFGLNKDGVEVIADKGVEDKRLLVAEGEFGGVLAVQSRDGNKLSAVLRDAWDGLTLRTLTRRDGLVATNPHISIVGHITMAELQHRLSQSDTFNGYSNRFLWICVRRAHLLPFGGHIEEDIREKHAGLLRAILEYTRAGELAWSDDARAIWEDAYPRLTAARPGAWGGATSRAEAHTLRLAQLYAVADRSEHLKAEHLKAALAVWDYCQDSARCVFGDRTGNATADKVLAALRQSAPAGLTRSEIREGVLGRNVSSKEIADALGSLDHSGLARHEKTPTSGRPVETWYAINAINAVSRP